MTSDAQTPRPPRDPPPEPVPKPNGEPPDDPPELPDEQPPPPIPPYEIPPDPPPAARRRWQRARNPTDADTSGHTPSMVEVPAPPHGHGRHLDALPAWCERHSPDYQVFGTTFYFWTEGDAEAFRRTRHQG